MYSLFSRSVISASALLLGLSIATFAQSFTGTATVGAGANIVQESAPHIYSNSPDISGAFEFRFAKYLGADVGLNTAFPNYTFEGGNGLFLPPVRETAKFFTYGLTGVLPLKADRVEIFGQVGGGYVWHSETLEDVSLNGSLWYTGGGVRFAIDPQKHWWAGTSARYYRGGSVNGWPASEYISWQGTLGYRFGLAE